jgi:glycosyltransferase involved in cell wall biosynthesis
MWVFTGTPRYHEIRQFGARDGALLPTEYVNDLPVQRVKLPQNSQVSRQMVYVSALTNYCRQPATRPDLVQTISISLYWLPWWFSFRRLGIPLVLTHTMLGEMSSNPWKQRLQHIYRRLPFQLADRVVVSSGVARDALLETGITTHIEVIPNGVDLNRFHPVTSSSARKALREQLGLEPTGELILFVGSLLERKGVDVLLEAWKSIARKRSRAYLVLVGPDYRDRPHPHPSFESKLKSLIADSGAEGRVVVTGRVDNVEVYFQAADIFVLPSRREGMPNVVPEAFGCGLACILTPFIGLPDEFGRPGEHYVLAERTPEALAKAILVLLDRPEHRQRLGRQSRRWVEEHMDVERSLDQYAALYRELVMRSRKGN